MNWAEFRTNHLLTNGPSTRAELSKAYASYKKSTGNSLRSPSRVSIRSPSTRSPPRLPSRAAGLTTRSPTRSYGNINTINSRSPTRSPTRSYGSLNTTNGPTRSYNSLKKTTGRLDESYANFNSLNKSTTVKSPQKKAALLTMKDFDKMAKGKKFLIVVLYADWCGHCTAMRDKLGNKMKNTDTIVFYEDGTLDESVKDYFPHVLYYENGDRRKDLTVEDVVTYLK